MAAISLSFATSTGNFLSPFCSIKIHVLPRKNHKLGEKLIVAAQCLPSNENRVNLVDHFNGQFKRHSLCRGQGLGKGDQTSSTMRPNCLAVRSFQDNSIEIDWVEATSHFFQDDTRPIMLFDGVCNLCNGGVQFVRNNDHNRRIRFEPLQSKSGRDLLRRSGRSPDDISSVVFVLKDRSYIKSEAVLKIMEYLDLPFPQLAHLLNIVPLFLRDSAYEKVASNRYAMFGRSESCEI